MSNPGHNESRLNHALAGMGLGLLVGIIAGLSVSPVVSVLLGALAALIAAFLGLAGGAKADTEASAGQLLQQAHRLQMNGIRAGFFGTACVVGILLGMFIRTNDLFLPSVEEQVNSWVHAGYEKELAREYVAFERLGIKPAKSEVEFSDIQKRKSSALFSGDDESLLCDEINLERYGDDAREVLLAYSQQDSENLAGLARIIENLEIDDATLYQLIKTLSETLCEIEHSSVENDS